MPQSIYPAITKVDTRIPLNVSDADAQSTRESILDVGERVNKHLEIVTGLELEAGEGEND